MAHRDVDGLNAGYASLLLDEYLENPDSVPAEWRGSSRAAAPPSCSPVIRACSACSRRSATATDTWPKAPAAQPPRQAVPPAPVAPTVDETLLGGVAAAMSLVKAHRTHGHLAARLDPLGSEPPGSPLSTRRG